MGIKKISSDSILEDKFKEIIKKSSLDQADKNLWLRLSGNLKGTQIEAVLKAIGSREDFLKILTSNLKQKIEANKNKDTKKLEKIAREEEKFLENF